MILKYVPPLFHLAMKTDKAAESLTANHYIRIHRPSSSPPRYLPKEDHNIHINPERPLQSPRSPRGSLHPSLLSPLSSITTRFPRFLRNRSNFKSMDEGNYKDSRSLVTNPR
jgi:hypothetical protein